MFSRYVSLRILYYSIGALLIAGSAFFTANYPNLMLLDLFAVLVIVLILIGVLTVIAFKMFNKEVMSCLYDCHVREYMDKLDKRMKTARAPAMKSSYADYSALGYIMLGDYDSAFDCCQKITTDVNRPNYYRYMVEYYLNRGLMDQAEKTLCDYKAFAIACKKKSVVKLCNRHMKDVEYAVNVRKGIFDGAEEYYRKRLNDDEVKKVLISKVSFSYSLGKLLLIKGDKVQAKEYLQFAFDNAGDTKYRALSGQLLSEV